MAHRTVIKNPDRIDLRTMLGGEIGQAENKSPYMKLSNGALVNLYSGQLSETAPLWGTRYVQGTVIELTILGG